MEQEIIKRYVEDRIGRLRIGEEFGIPEYQVKKILVKNGIRIRKFARDEIPFEDIRRMYFDEKMSSLKIAKVLNISDTTVRKRLQKAGYELESGAEQSKKRIGKLNSKWRGHEGIIGSLWRSIINSASSRKINVDFTKEDLWNLWLKQDGKCALSGISLKLPHSTEDWNSRDFSASLDRIDSSICYTISNVQWVSKFINISKWSMGQERYIEICRMVAEHEKNR